MLESSRLFLKTSIIPNGYNLAYGGGTMRHRRLVVIISSALALTGCNTLSVQDNLEVISSVAGAVGGGVIGSQVAGRGQRTQGAAIGVVIGTLIGHEVGRYLAEQDRKRLAAATEQTVSTGQSQEWRNPKTGVSGRTEVVKTATRKKQATVPVLKDRVARVPPLDMNQGGTYRATAAANVRGGPGTDYKQVGSLVRGQAVAVTGQVEGQPWYLIQQNGVGTGFVHANTLQRQSAQVASAGAAPVSSDQVEQKTVTATTQCRTIKQTIQLSDGTTKSENVTACESPDGWEVS